MKNLVNSDITVMYYGKGVEDMPDKEMTLKRLRKWIMMIILDFRIIFKSNGCHELIHKASRINPTLYPYSEDLIRINNSGYYFNNYFNNYTL